MSSTPNLQLSPHQHNRLIGVSLLAMWSILSVAALVYAAAVSAVSTAGNRLLVVLDDVAEKDLYSQFLGDLTGASLRGMLHHIFDTCSCLLSYNN